MGLLFFLGFHVCDINNDYQSSDMQLYCKTFSSGMPTCQKLTLKETVVFKTLASLGFPANYFVDLGIKYTVYSIQYTDCFFQDFALFPVLEIEPRPSHVLGKC